MTDGRKHRPAHRAPRTPLARRVAVPTVAAIALGLAGSGALVAPAAADLDERIDQAQARVDRLDRVADQRSQAQERAQSRLGASRQLVERLSARIDEQRERTGDLRERMARGVLVEHATDAQATTDGTDGADVLPVASSAMPATSERMLAGVALVTEDAGETSSALQETEETRTELVERRAEVREVLRERRQAARAASARAERAGAELGAAQGRLSSLEDELAERQAEQEAEQVSSGAVAYAMAQVGKSYVWGAAGPDAFDCSGLTMAAWATEGVSLPHNSQAQYAAGTPVSESELQPGDLVFYYSPISHVGMYVGNGQVVNALNPGSGVQVSGLHDMPYSGAVRPG